MGGTELSGRLRAVADAVPRGIPVADVGTDHALLPIHLVSEGLVPQAIAIDVGDGPMAAARESLAAAGSPPVQLRQGSGLQPLRPGEVGTVVLAGIGGPLIRELVDASPEVVASVGRLVLQPNTDWPKVRRWILDHAWPLEDEVLVQDAGKFYVILSVRPCPGPVPDWDERDLEFGPLVRRTPTPVYTRWIDHRTAQTCRALDEVMRKSPADRRAGELSTLLSWLAGERQRLT